MARHPKFHLHNSISVESMSRRSNKREDFRRAPREKRNFGPTYFFVCEGEKTEISYFEMVKETYQDKVQIKAIYTGRTDAIGIVKEAKLHQSDYGISGINYFCVMDRDDTEVRALKQARNESIEAGIGFILSVPCFDFWLILHFDASTGPLTKDEAQKKAARLLSNPNSKIAALNLKQQMELQGRINKAIENGQNLSQHHREVTPFPENPSSEMWRPLLEIKNL